MKGTHIYAAPLSARARALARLLPLLSCTAGSLKLRAACSASAGPAAVRPAAPGARPDADQRADPRCRGAPGRRGRRARSASSRPTRRWRWRRERDLDLVEVAPESRPPVARLLDYSKYKYEQEQKAKAARKHQQQVNVREIKLRPKIADHDYKTKKGHVERFLKHQDKVKVTIMFRGREQAHPERGRALLERLFEDVGELAVDRAAPPAGGPQHAHDARALAGGAAKARGGAPAAKRRRGGRG